MKNLHIHSPEKISKTYRILLKGCRYFIDKEFSTLKKALNYAFCHYEHEFRIFEQSTYEYYEPLNIELVKVNTLFKE